MSLTATGTINDYELGIRRNEIKSITREMETIESDQYMSYGEKRRQLSELRETRKTCRAELKHLRRQIYNNFL